MGLRFNKLKNFYVNGTTAAVANQPLLSKPRNRWNSKHLFPFGFVQEGIYFETLDREGSQFDTAEAAFSAATVTNIVSVTLGPLLGVSAYLRGGKLYARAKVVSATGAITQGAEVTVNNATTTDISICKIGALKFAIAYCDDGGSDYLCSRICTVTAAGVITQGTEKEINAAALKKASGTAICYPGDYVLAIAFTLNSDGHLDVVGCPFNGITFSTPGTPVEFESGATTKYPALASYTTGEFIVVYQDNATANDPITYRTGKCFSNGLVETYGDVTSMAGAAQAATSISVKSYLENRIVVGWIDTNDGHLRAAYISEGDLTLGDELAINTSNTAYFSFDMSTSKKGVCAFEDTGDSNYGKVKLFSLSENSTTHAITITEGEADVFSLATSTYVSVMALTDKIFVASFVATTGKHIVGIITPHLIDIRSQAASIAYGGFMLSLENAGLGKMAAYKVSGTTKSSANTAMDTKETLPWNKHQNVILLFKDEGMYVEDDGTEQPYKSGISTSGRTIDIRSQVASEAYEAYVLKINGKLKVIDVD